MEESKEKQNKRTASADPLKTYLESTQEFFDMWMNSYQSTFGKLTQVPAFGPIREKQEKLMKGFPVYVNLYNTWVESNINFQTVFTEAMKKTYEKMITETKGEITTTKYKDFYKIWIETYSETLKEFMKSGHFASDMGKLMTNFMDYQKYNKEMIEENVLKPGNLPTKTEIDELNKDLYTLRKIVKDLDKKIISDLDNLDDDINEKIDEISKRIDELSNKIDDQKIDIKLDKKIAQSDLDEKLVEISKKTKTDIQLDIDKKIAELSKKIDDQKIDIKLDIDKKIAELSKKIDDQKIDIKLDIDKKIAKKIDDQKIDIKLELPSDLDKEIS